MKNHSLSVFQESYSDYHKINLNKCKPMEPVSIDLPFVHSGFCYVHVYCYVHAYYRYLNLQIICTVNMYKVIDVFWLLFL